MIVTKEKAVVDARELLGISIGERDFKEKPVTPEEVRAIYEANQMLHQAALSQPPEIDFTNLPLSKAGQVIAERLAENNTGLTHERP